MTADNLNYQFKQDEIKEAIAIRDNLMAIALTNGAIRVYNLKTGEQINFDLDKMAWVPHDGPITEIIFIDKNIVRSRSEGASNTRFRIWDISKRECIDAVSLTNLLPIWKLGK